MDNWGELWELAKTAGPFGTIFATALWWLERSERVALRTQYDVLLERTLVAMAAGTTAMEKFSDLIARRRS